jgi:hypothetical protein
MRAINLEHWNIPGNIPTRAQFMTRHARHVLSRRTFITSVAATAAIGLVPGSVLARRPASSPPPMPTSNTIVLNGVTFHFTPFEPAGNDPSSIGDFNGLVGVADVQGTGTATYPDRGPETLLFDTDMRFMSGSYVGYDGAVHSGAFALV